MAYKKKSSAKTVIYDSRPQLEDGCILDNKKCKGVAKVCPTCSMVYCESHFKRGIHISYCAARVKQDLELIKDGNSKF